MRVLLIMPWIKPGGAELIAVRTAQQLPRFGHEVRLLALFADFSHMDRTAGKVHYILARPWLGRLCRRSRPFLYGLGPIILLVLLWRQRGWAQLLLPHSLPAYWLAALVKKGFGRKVVWLCNEPPHRRSLTDGGLTEWLMWRLADSWLDYWAVKQMDQIIVYSQAIKNEVKARYGRTAQLVRLGVDTAFFCATDQALERQLIGQYRLGGKQVWLMVGKLHRQKNQRLGVALLGKLQTQYPTAVLVLVGGGPDGNYLKQMIRKLGIASRVVLPGFCRRETVRAWYGISSLVLFPPVQQTAMTAQSWGFVPFEALCRGKTSLVSRGSGAAEIIGRYKFGLVAQPSLSGFAAKISQYYQQRHYYQLAAVRGREWIRKNLSWDKFGTGINRALYCDS